MTNDNYHHTHHKSLRVIFFKLTVACDSKVSLISTRMKNIAIYRNIYAPIMGQGKSQFTEEELQDYQDLTYFTKKEVLYAHQKFKTLAPEKVGHNKNAKLPMTKILQYPELRVNPFRDRICRVFSSSGDGDCTFEDFLDMMSVFSENAPKAVKAEHAFRIFDFDSDDMLGVSDLHQVIERLCGPDQKLSDSEMQQLVQNVLEEADLDDDGALSFAEFEHIVDKSSDFCNSFRIRL